MIQCKVYSIILMYTVIELKFDNSQFKQNFNIKAFSLVCDLYSNVLCANFFKLV